MGNYNWDKMDLNAIDKVMTDIVDYANNANKILGNIDVMIDDTKDFFDCDCGDSFRAQYQLFKSNHVIFNKNYLSYNTDFANAKANYRLREEVGVEIMNEAKKSVEVSFDQREENL